MADDSILSFTDSHSKNAAEHSSIAVGNGVPILGLTRALYAVTATGAIGSAVAAAAQASPAWAIAGSAATTIAAIGGIVMIELGRQRGTFVPSAIASPKQDWEAEIAVVNDILKKASAVSNPTFRMWVKARIEHIGGEWGPFGDRVLSADQRDANRLLEDLFEACSTARGRLTPEVAKAQLSNGSPRLATILSRKHQSGKQDLTIKLIIVHRSTDDKDELKALCEQWSQLGAEVSTLNFDEARSVPGSSSLGDSVWLLDGEDVSKAAVIELFKQDAGYLKINTFVERTDRAQAVKRNLERYADYAMAFPPRIANEESTGRAQPRLVG